MQAPVTTIYDIEGKAHDLTGAEVDSVSVLDEGLTDEDYTEASQVLVELLDGTSFTCDPWDELNRGEKEFIWDLFLTM